MSTEAEHEHEQDHATKGDEKHEEGEHQHSEFHVEYELACASVSHLTSMTFDYFKAFPGSQELDVAIVSPKGQTSYEVAREKPSLDLKGIM